VTDSTGEVGASGGPGGPIRASGLGGGRGTDDRDGRETDDGAGYGAEQGHGSGVGHRVSCVHFGPGGDPSVVLGDTDADGADTGMGSSTGDDD
jgi:hypothetical protein